MINNVVNYKDYVIITDEGEEKGIFFRNPLQTVYFDAYDCDEHTLSAWKYLNDIKNPIRRLYEILIGNGDIVKNIKSWSEEMDYAGFSGHILCSPIYFKRDYRKLLAYSCNRDSNITRIQSYGYESEFNFCAGYCDIEKTIIHFNNGKTTKIKRKEQYHFTYEYIVKEIIDTGIKMED